MITSTSNSQVRQIAALQTKAKLRDELRLFVAEGTKMVEELPEVLLQKVFCSVSYAKNKKNLNFSKKFLPEVVPDLVFSHMSNTKNPQGILAVARQPEYTIEDLFTGGPIIILESLQDPGNLGTILRTGEGAGIGGVLVNRETVDFYNPKVVRSTMGSLYRVPHLVCPDLEESVKALKMRGFHVYAAHLDGAQNYTEGDYREKTAFLIGNEGNGLTDRLAKTADTFLRIPMEGKVESLNAAVAAAILMYEAHRQKH